MPPWSVRIDPFNWLLEGRLGLELEVGVLSFMTVELVPVFVTTSKPATLNFSGFDDPVRRDSNGLGAMSGASIGAGFWIGGKPFRGMVLRAIFENYGYTYRALDGSTEVDRVSHTERVLMGMFGSMSRFGAFTITGGIGLGMDMNKEERCYTPTDGPGAPTGSGCGDIHLLVPPNSIYSVTSGIYPVVLRARFSLGVTFD